MRISTEKINLEQTKKASETAGNSYKDHHHHREYNPSNLNEFRIHKYTHLLYYGSGRVMNSSSGFVLAEKI
ncbi:hypothetical protein QR98_0040550 [Sarcoptes scabiei]|uniref:Uncharacterized protein n=1 Tax=Sarcoptes scabiei TaxID=52283 RepID=A0A132A579_SARSC|nr:hypothetical protein QR98_0040550 [Sarcoptes scabiei]